MDVVNFVMNINNDRLYGLTEKSFWKNVVAQFTSLK